MTKKKSIASISLDLDNQWSYMKIHGDEGWDKYPSYLSIFLPYVLDILDELDLKITFFVVGKDTELEDNVKYLRMITERGHEIGNHSYHHESWLQTYSYEKIENEIKQAEEAIEKATGQRATAFRGPGFSWSKDLLRVLQSRGYKFDASTLPTYLGPIARMYYFKKSNLTREEKKARKELFGKFSEGFRKLKPYNWDLGEGKILMEIPVTTIPVFKFPFHQSYLLYISSISKKLMKAYLWFAIMMCKTTKTAPSYLLHPLDLIGGDDIPQLAFFPGMNMRSEKKLEVFKTAMTMLKQHFDLLPMSEFSEHFTKNIKTVKPT
jgi:hypothetical protein